MQRYKLQRRIQLFSLTVLKKNVQQKKLHATTAWTRAAIRTGDFASLTSQRSKVLGREANFKSKYNHVCACLSKKRMQAQPLALPLPVTEPPLPVPMLLLELTVNVPEFCAVITNGLTAAGTTSQLLM